MSWPDPILRTLTRLDYIKRELSDFFVARERAIDLLALATVCQEHLLLLGPPGTAKTELVTRFSERVAAQQFTYLLTRFTEPSELFGTLDLNRFREGTYEIRTENMLPKAEIAFLDEVFQSSSAILNALLTLVNERVYYNGSRRQTAPLISLIGASNELPDDPGLQAFADRFALRLRLESVAEDRLSDLVSQGWALELERVTRGRQSHGSASMTPLRVDELRELHLCLAQVKTKSVEASYAELVRELLAEGLELSDRRIVKGLKLVAGAALLRRAEEAGPEDLWPLNYFWLGVEEAEVARRVIQPRVDAGGGPRLDSTRSVDEILADLSVIRAQEPRLHSEVALGAHLKAINRLRRELIRDHPGDVDARRTVEEAVQFVMKRLGGLDV